jgi:hypothetical protein
MLQNLNFSLFYFCLDNLFLANEIYRREAFEAKVASELFFLKPCEVSKLEHSTGIAR